jgi:hypothetical protein
VNEQGIHKLAARRPRRADAGGGPRGCRARPRLVAGGAGQRGVTGGAGERGPAATTGTGAQTVG